MVGRSRWPPLSALPAGPHLWWVFRRHRDDNWERQPRNSHLCDHSMRIQQQEALMDATTRRGDQPANDQHSHGLDDSHAAPTARRDLWSPKDHRLRPETSSDAPKETPMAMMPCAGMVTPPQVTYPHQHVLGQGAIVEPGNCPTECQKCEFLIQSVRVADPEQCDEDLDNARMEVVRIVRGGDSSLLIRPRGFRKNLTWFKPTIVGGTAGTLKSNMQRG